MAMLALVGPTASGKSEAALAIAPRLGAEIVSVDSMLVYRGMDVGTAKPTAEQRAAVPHHLVDLAEPSERFTVARYQDLARSTVRSVACPLLVGGSGLYLRAVVDDLAFPPEDPVVRASLEAEADDLGADALYRRLADMDPVAAARIEPGNVRRIIRALEVTAISGAPFSSFASAWDRYDADRVRAAGVRVDREAHTMRIGERVFAMLRNGWLEEVRGLMDRGFGAWLTASQAIGYAELAEHLEGRLSLDEAAERTVKRTRELARRQMAWFLRDPRIRWFDAGAGGASEVADEIRAYLGSE
ncbi:MAG: tRNA (adenosine(37)-N6)-dimethylallyltransferase MiaA [Actinobacteria bacterium]|nr:MAG: tRNA (adenosine(37)-N6)-dimethylallyltransferase MiaA [Actinomycetota bacterium]